VQQGQLADEIAQRSRPSLRTGIALLCELNLNLTRDLPPVVNPERGGPEQLSHTVLAIAVANDRRRRLLPTTKALENAIAAPAIMG